MSSSKPKEKSVARVFQYLEVPAIYTLTAITVFVSLLVYGMTLIRSGNDGGLLGMLKPFFGVPYAVVIGSLLVAILAVNRRGKLLVVLALGEILHFIILISPTAARSFVLDEYLNSAVLIACLLATSCIYYDLVETEAPHDD